MFHMLGDAGNEKLDTSDLGKGPALSSFQDKPGEAVTAVRQQIDKAKSLIPAEMWKGVALMIFATAGMRLVGEAKAQAVYEGLRSGLLTADFPFDSDAFVAKTISGREEGVYAFVAANYLSERISTDLVVRSPELMGVMDLGGSSTQIAVAPVAHQGDALQSSLGEGHMYVKSFLSLGMERMRKLTYATTVQDAHWLQRASAKVPNPCAFIGLDDSAELWRGTGDSLQCQHVISAILFNESDKCRKHKQGAACLPTHSRKGHHMIPKKNPFKQAKATSDPHFFMISGYVFVADFARWWLRRPGVLPQPAENVIAAEDRQTLSALAKGAMFSNPSLKELRSAAAVLCAGAWTDIKNASSDASSRHKYTSAEKAANRCFELNYIICLLSVGYGFPDDTRPFEMVDAIGGRDVEWTLGAYLLSRSSTQLDIGEGHIGSMATMASSIGLQGDTAMLLMVASIAAVGIIFAVRRRNSKEPCLPGVGGGGGKQI